METGYANSKLGSYEYLGHQLQSNSLVLQTTRGGVEVSLLSDSVMEVNYLTGQDKSLASFAIAKKEQQIENTLQESRDNLVFSGAGITAVINKCPFHISYFRAGELLVQEEVGFFHYDTVRGFRFKLQQGEKLLGAGERVMGMDRRGQRLAVYNCAHYGYEAQSECMYFSMPLLLSSRKYMLLFDNTANAELDLGKSEEDILQFEARGGRTSYLVVAAETYPGLLTHYTEITGRQPLPPKWAFGNYASRFGYRNRQQVEEVVAAFAREDIPLDTVVLDLYWFGPDIQGHMGNLDWDLQAFPAPEQMIANFKQQGIKTVLITEPFILTSSNKWQEAVQADALVKNLGQQAKSFDCFFGHTGLVDVFSRKGQQWFSQQYQRLFEQGVNGWWGDLGEPEVHPADCIHTLENGELVTADEIHNVYGHKWAELLYHKTLQLAPERRPFIMMRSGAAGSQRYGVLPWTGDVHRSWAGFTAQVELGLQMGLVGLAYIHSDLGGFAEGEHFDPELYLRWLQFGVFQPIYRPHAQEHIAPEPVLHDESTKNTARELIKLRYSLLAYNYTLAYENHISGMPLMRPLFFAEPENLELMDNCDSYMWGDAFHITPVTEAGLKKQQLYLLPGVWFDFWTDEKYSGGRQVEMDVTQVKFPVMVRAGSFIPMLSPQQTTELCSSEHLFLHYYHDSSIKQATGRMYEDDGNNPLSVEQQAYQLLTFEAQSDQGQFNFSLKQHGLSYEGAPAKRCIKLILHGCNGGISRARLNGKMLQQPVHTNQQSGLIEVEFEWSISQPELQLVLLP